jgi:polyvinyl alcohol dehydrogenase (cytochrome)
MKRVWATIGGAMLVLAAPLLTHAQDPAANGEALFNARCKTCHDPAIERAPNRTTLAATPATQIVDALTTGVMVPMAGGLSAADNQALAAYLTAPARAAAAGGRPQAAQPGVDTPCATNPPIRATASDWTSQGFDPTSHRFQPNPGLTAAHVPKLKLKWSFAMSGGGAPTVIGDWLFAANRNGKFYALDARTGCVRWVVDGAGSRTTPMVVRSPISPSGWATFIGERNRTVRAFDAATGKPLWTSPALETLPAAGITGSPLVSGERIFVPLSSGEEGSARQNSYPCCSFRGSLAALDLKTGRLLWQTPMITEPLRPLRKNAAGTQMQGPAGAAIWSAPTVDEKRGLIYVATGDSYTDAPAAHADAIVALDMATGKIAWSNQVTANDNYIMGCPLVVKSANCPQVEGPDYDFGASPILFTLKSGKQLILAGQKSGVAYGLDANTGKTVWSTKVGAGSHLAAVRPQRRHGQSARRGLASQAPAGGGPALRPCPSGP